MEEIKGSYYFNTHYISCSKCKGDGFKNGKKCDKCKGTGWVRKLHNLEDNRKKPTLL